MTTSQLKERYNYYTDNGRYKLLVSHFHLITNDYFIHYDLRDIFNVVDNSINDLLFIYNVKKLLNKSTSTCVSN